MNSIRITHTEGERERKRERKGEKGPHLEKEGEERKSKRYESKKL